MESGKLINQLKFIVESQKLSFGDLTILEKELHELQKLVSAEKEILFEEHNKKIESTLKKSLNHIWGKLFFIPLVKNSQFPL